VSGVAASSRIVLASRSADKIAEIRQILAGSALEIVSLGDIGLPASPAEGDLEVFATFRENALAKARYFAKLLQEPVLADDSGLEVDALGGRPGVRTKRFARDYADTTGAPAPAPEAVDGANNALLLQLLREIPDPERGARYVCAACLARPEEPAGIIAVGTCPGRIAHTPAGTGGFGYDPLFELPSLGVTFAQLDRAEKNRRSHRAHAFRALRALIA
jgi:XTP/dITP diphosphohydrolase